MQYLNLAHHVAASLACSWFDEDTILNLRFENLRSFPRTVYAVFKL